MPSMRDLLRFLSGAALFALGGLTAFPPSNHSMWVASIAATEYGYWLALAALFPMIPTRGQTRVGRAGGLLSLGAIPLLLFPVYRAQQLGATVRSDFDARFGTERRVHSNYSADPRPEPFVLQELIKPLDVPAIRLEQRTYATYGDEKLVLDIYRPGYISEGAPAVIVVPGWGWKPGEGQFMALNAYLASRDYVVITPNYRTAPRWKFPASRDDVLTAIAYVQTHAGELGVDASRLVLIGRAEGGALAMLAAYTAGASAIKGVVSIYGSSDLRFEYDHPSPPALRNTHAVLEAYLGGSPTRAEDNYFAASPVNFVSPTSPPTLLIHGLRDETIRAEQSTRLRDRLREANVKHAFVGLPWATHGCDRSFEGPCGQIVLYAVERFVDAVTVAPKPPAPARPPKGKLARR
jgi:acetyl esterase/lipase